MKISAGILAWNEEGSIGAAIASLAGQTLLAKVDGGSVGLEIVVVPNGCTDGTADAARRALQELQQRFPAVRASVHDLPTPGKVNAWNEFVHRLSAPDSDYLLLLDADIELLGADTLWSMVQVLEEQPNVQVATDRPVKHLEREGRSGLLGRLLLGAGAMTQAAPGQLTGQLYCARAALLRRIVLPDGLIVEDGFLKQMICTEGFSHKVDNSLIARAPGAAHVFECYTSVRDVFNHQVRQAIGHTIYTYLRDDLQRPGLERPVFAELARRSRANPEWFRELVKAEVARRGWWVMDTPSLTMRWRRIRFAKGAAKVKFFLVALLALAVDIPVFLISNHRLRTGGLKGIWKDTKNQSAHVVASSPS